MQIRDLMKFTYVTASKGRKSLSEIVREVDNTGSIYVFKTDGKSKAAMVDLDLLEEFIEYMQYGLSAKELIRRSREKTIPVEALKKEFGL